MKNLSVCLLFILAITTVDVVNAELLNITEASDDGKIAVTYVGTQPISFTDDLIVVSDEEVVIRGSVADDSGIDSVAVNSEKVPVADDGVFVTKIPIDYGKNQIAVKAIYETDNLSVHAFTIYQRPDRTNKDFALFFATDVYSGEKDENGEWQDLGSPIRDAEAIAKNLRDNYGFETKVFKNLTRRELFSTLYAYRNDFNGVPYDVGSQLFIYFAGHGYYSVFEKEGYLITTDTDSPTSDPTMESAVAHSKLERIIDAIRCSRILLLLDTDFSGMFNPNFEAMPEPSIQTFDPNFEAMPKLRGIMLADLISRKTRINEMLKFEARCYIASSTGITVDGSAGHSPFANAFLNALNTKGGKDLLLTLDEVWGEIQKSKDAPIYDKIIEAFKERGKEFERPEPRKGNFGNMPRSLESNFLFFPKPQVVLDAPLPENGTPTR